MAYHVLKSVMQSLLRDVMMIYEQKYKKMLILCGQATTILIGHTCKQLIPVCFSQAAWYEARLDIHAHCIDFILSALTRHDPKCYGNQDKLA